jgi:cell division protein FtsB
MGNEWIIGIILVVLYLMHARGTRLAFVAQIEDLRLANNRNVREIDELKAEIEKLQDQINRLNRG